MRTGLVGASASAYAGRPMTTHSHAKKSDQPDRRSGAHRRRVDKGPPGGRERRRRGAPRRPAVAEIEMSESEWASLAAELPPPSPPSPPASKKKS